MGGSTGTGPDPPAVGSSSGPRTRSPAMSGSIVQDQIYYIGPEASAVGSSTGQDQIHYTGPDPPAVGGSTGCDRRVSDDNQNCCVAIP